MLHFFFDLDGTLTDSAQGITRCLAHAIREAGGEPPDASELEGFIGTPLGEIFAELLGTRDPEVLDRARHCYAERFHDVGIRENALYPGVREGLDRLQELDATLYVATAKGPRAARDVVELFGIGEYFSGVYGVDHEKIADKAELLRGAVARGIDAERAFMIGDRHHDVAAGRAAGMSTVWASWGYGTSSERDEARPDHTLLRFAAVPEWAAALAGRGDGA